MKGGKERVSKSDIGMADGRSPLRPRHVSMRDVLRPVQRLVQDPPAWRRTSPTSSPTRPSRNVRGWELQRRKVSDENPSQPATNTHLVSVLRYRDFAHGRAGGTSSVSPTPVNRSCHARVRPLLPAKRAPFPQGKPWDHRRRATCQTLPFLSFNHALLLSEVDADVGAEIEADLENVRGPRPLTASRAN